MNEDNMPLVTAVIPVYNHESYVVASIRSILNQTYRNIELIVIDDGSKDRSNEMILTLVEECKQRFARFEYIHRQNAGLSATLNEALSIANGVYFTALASDDIALPEKVEWLVNALENKGSAYAASFGNALFIDENGQMVRLDTLGQISKESNAQTFDNFMEFHTRTRDIDYKGEEFGTYPSLITGNYLPAMSNVVRTNAIIEAGGWTIRNLIEDWEMWLKLSKAFRFVYVDRAVALYRWHDVNSIKIAGHKLNICSLRLLAKEKSNCAQNSLLPSWRKAYFSLLLSVLLDRRIAWADKLSGLDLSEIPHLPLHVAKALAQKVFNAS